MTWPGNRMSCSIFMHEKLVYLNMITAIVDIGSLHCFDPLLHRGPNLKPEPVLALRPGQVDIELLVQGGQGGHVAEHNLRRGCSSGSRSLHKSSAQA